MLTEVDHGLDASNLETTATLLPSGEFELHTPHAGAAKFVASVQFYILVEAHTLYCSIQNYASDNTSSQHPMYSSRIC